MDTGENIEIEEKIRRALKAPSFENENSSEQIQTATLRTTPIVKKKRSIFFSLKLFILATLIAGCYLSRTDPGCNLIFSGVVLKSERVLGVNLGIVRSLFAIKIKLNSEEFSNAMKQNNIALATFLLGWGLDPNATNAEGDTLLTGALKAGNTEIVSILLTWGAKASLANAKGELPLEFALTRPDFITILVKAGADVNSRNIAQQTLLIKAASQANLETIKTLVAAGADTNLQDALGKTALHYALESKQEQNIEYLKSVGADQNISDRAGVKVSEQLQLKVKEDLKATAEKTDSWWAKSQEQVKTVTVTAGPKMTAVRVMGKVIGVWERGKELVLKEASVQVRNVGGETANSVVVQVRLPGGKEIKLTGPETIEAYTTVKFSSQPAESITKNGELKANATCENCHK